MFVTSNGFQQIVARFFGGSFRAEKLRPHVVVDSHHTHSIPGEALDCFRTDQAGGAGDYNSTERTHRVKETRANRVRDRSSRIPRLRDEGPGTGAVEVL